MRRSTLSLPLLLLLLSAPLIAGGCASTKDQYAYAYPSAPPVYTQPAGFATPAANPAAAPLVMPAPVGPPPPGAGVAEAIPSIGRYASVSLDAMRTQAAQFVQAGVDALVVD